MQGGGSEDTCKKAYIVHEFTLNRVVVSSERLDVTNYKCISVIPTQQQVCDAISVTSAKREDTKWVRQFPFGLLDYDGLKDIEKYYLDIQIQHHVSEEKHWLEGFEMHVCSKLG